MRVAKWGNSLAVRLPAAVIEALELKEGEEIEINIAGRRAFDIARAPDREDVAEPFAGLSRSAAARLPVRPGRGQCPVAFSTATSCSI